MQAPPLLILVIVFAILLALGVPIAFCIALSTVVAMCLIMDFQDATTTMAQVIANTDSFVLLAIPFFILAGQIMNRGGIARRIIDFAKAIVGPFPGGLAFVNIVSAMLFGALSGSAVAAASAIGGVMSPHMEEEGYDPGYSAAVNITSSTTGLIIPPSNILIVYALVAEESVGRLFVAGYVPGALVGLSLMAVAGLIAKARGYPTAERVSIGVAIRRFLAAAPSLGLIVVVIGGIVGGVFTATEAAAVAVLYALILAFIYRELRISQLPRVLLDSATTTAVVMLLVATSMCMSRLLALERIPVQISDALLGLSDNPIIVLILINLVLLIVGTFMDITPAVLIFAPIFLPITDSLGIDRTHFGIVMVLNLCIGLCTPPVGSVLFVGCGVGKVSIAKVVKPMLPLYAAMIVALLLVTYVPALSLWLPHVCGY
ncbi:MAG: TRAP transporter large permease [Phycisphaerales bacterium]|nr:MAG: TRAP transporter large permease [Phycisphaerales bacterium]